MLYTAVADEWSIPAQTASTQRGAVKMLKAALLATFQDAGRQGELGDVLDAAGYNGNMVRERQTSLDGSSGFDFRIPSPLPMTTVEPPFLRRFLLLDAVQDLSELADLREK